MVSQTNEHALETAIANSLHNTGYQIGSPDDFNKHYALDERLFWQFLENTQTPELNKLKKHHPHDWQRKIIERFDRLMKKHGLLYLLKKA